MLAVEVNVFVRLFAIRVTVAVTKGKCTLQAGFTILHLVNIHPYADDTFTFLSNLKFACKQNCPKNNNTVHNFTSTLYLSLRSLLR